MLEKINLARNRSRSLIVIDDFCTKSIANRIGLEMSDNILAEKTINCLEGLLQRIPIQCNDNVLNFYIAWLHIEQVAPSIFAHGSYRTNRKCDLSIISS